MYLFATICTNKFYVKTYKLTFFKGIMSPLKAFEKNKSTLDTLARVERSYNRLTLIIAKFVHF